VRVEHWWYTLPLRLRSLFRRDRVESELDEELLFHLEMKIEEGVAAGLTPDEARHRAMRSMGGLEQRKEEIRDTRRVAWLTDFVADLGYALRGLRRTPGLTLLVVATLAVGIGMTATPFSMLDALVFRPYPVPDPGRVMTLVSTSHDESYGAFSFREYVDLRQQSASYAGVVANTAPAPVGFAAERGATPEIRAGMLVSANYFSVLGVEPTLGRGFRPQEDEVPGRGAVAVLGPDFWRRELAADPAVVGRTILVNGTELTVIGVAPESFPGMYVFTRPDIYVPFGMAARFSTDPRKRFFEDRDDRELHVKARLAPGVSRDQARHELAALAAHFERAYPETNRGRGARLLTQFELRTRADDVNWKFGVIFTVLALATLAVACTNVAGLLLARARSRTREIALRLAIGAGRGRLLRLLLTESLVLALVGGIGGVVVGYAGIRLLRTFAIPAELPVKVPFQMDLHVLAACLVFALAAALVCGLAPALQATRIDLASGLKTADVDPPDRKRLWGRSALIVAQVAISLMLLTASFLMARGFERTALESTGFVRDHLLLTRFDPRLIQYDAARTQRFYEQLTERLRGTPGVRGVTLTLDPPLGLGDLDAASFVPEGFQMPADRESFTSMMDTVDPSYFATLGIDLVAGRPFRATDRAGSPPVAIVNQHLAERFWPHADAVGRHLALADGGAVEIVGVARTIKVRDSVDKEADFVYLPLAQHPEPHLMLMVRTAGEPLEMVAPLKEVVRALDPDMPLLETRSYDDLYRYSQVEGPGIAIRLVGTLGLVGLLLAVAGLYGLVAYNVARRTREIGIRMAVGAGPSSVLRQMMSQGLVLVAIGTLIGLALGAAVERLMNAMVFHAGHVDLAAYLVVVPTMLAVTLLAAWLPARRATRIAPTLALRCE